MNAQLGTTALGLGGAAIGGYFGGPFGAQIGYAIGTLIGGLIFGNDGGGSITEGPRLSDLHVTASSYGSGIPIPYGRVAVPATMIWATDLIEVRIEMEDFEGNITISYEYFGNFAMSFGEGPVAVIRKVWASGQLLVDLSDDPDRAQPYRYGQRHYREYVGTETQLPDTLIEESAGVGNVPGHRGLVYVVFERLPLADFGNAVPKNMSAEVVSIAPGNFSQESLSVALSGHGVDNTTLDLSTPFAYTTLGATLVSFNRISGREYFTVDISTEPNLAAGIFPRDSSLVANIEGKIVVDPILGDVYVGMEGTTGTGGGFAVYDKKGVFVSYTHVGGFGALRTGVIFPGTAGIRVLAFATLTRATKLQVVSYEPNPFDPENSRGVQVFRGSVTAPDLGNDPTWFDYAIDPTLNASRAWAMRHGSGSGGGPPVIIEINPDGSLEDEVELTALSGNPVGITYDTHTSSLIIATTTAIYKIQPNNYSILGQIGDGVPATDGGVQTGHTGTGNNSGFMRNQVITSGIYHFLALKESSEPTFSINLVRVRVQDMSIIDRFNSHELYDPDATWSSNGSTWDPAIPGMLDTVGGYKKYPFDRYSANGIPLSTILTDLGVRAGLDPTDIDVTAITDTVQGYVLTDPGTVRGAIDPLQAAFFFDGAEINFKLVFKPRNGTVVANIPATDLAAKVEGAEEGIKLGEPRRQEVEVARRVMVSFLNVDNDYQISTQMEQRILQNIGADLDGTTRSRTEVNFRLPIVMSDQQAREVASINLGVAWAERTTLEFSLPPKWMRLDPTDNITVEKVSSSLTTTFNARILHVEIGDGGVVSVRAALTDVAVFSPNVTAAPSPLNIARGIPTPVGNEMFLMNLPALRAGADDAGRAWFAAAPSYEVPLPDWQGSVLSQASISAGPYTPITSVVLPTTWGSARSVLGTFERFTVFDDVNSLTVDIVGDVAPVSVTDAVLFGGANYVYIPDTGELFQYGVATEDAPNIWTLSHLLRGRLGTEGFIALNSQNADVVFIDTDRMGIFSNATEVGLARYYVGTSIASASMGTGIVPFVNAAASLLPFSPTNVRGAYDGSGNIDITWRRRTRHSGEIKNLVEVDLNEGSEQYEVDIVSVADNFFGSVVLLVPADEDENDKSPAARNGAAGTLATIDNNDFKFGGGSLHCQPTSSTDQNSRVSFADSVDFSIGTNEYTIEMWIKFDDTTTSVNQIFASHYSASGNHRAWHIGWQGGIFTHFLSDDGTSIAPAIGVNFVFPFVAGTWYHVAATRDASDDVRTFIDGVLVGGPTAAAFSVHDSISAIKLGGLDVSIGPQPFFGRIDDFRFTIGTARYTTTFTPPTKAHPLLDEVEVKRTIGPILDVETATYTVADQTTDGYLPGTRLEVDVYQLSEAVGRGRPRRRVIFE